MNQTGENKKIAYILGNYPGKIETFVLNEMKELSRIGFNIYVCPIHHVPSSNGDDIARMVRAIDTELANLPGLILSHLFFLISRPVSYVRCLVRCRSYGGKRVFLKSVYFGWAIKRLGIGHVHSHFGWTATDSARVIRRLTGIPFSVSVHAADIYYLPDKLEQKLEEAEFVVTCVKNNRSYINRTFGVNLGRKVNVVYHGVDLELFKPAAVVEKVVDVLSIGNLVEKKGHRYLIEACATLKRKGISVKCLIVGEGPEKRHLTEMIKELDLQEDVEIPGRSRQAELPGIYAKSRIFALPSIITAAGDRDGIPNVLLEAMAMGVPVVSSDVPNIVELIEDGKDGILVPPRDAEALARAIERLLADREKYEVITANARHKVTERFDAKTNIHGIENLFIRSQVSHG